MKVNCINAHTDTEWCINGNMWSKSLYSYLEAFIKSQTMVDCVDCINCSYCTDCESCYFCDGCVDCSNCLTCTDCTACNELQGSNASVYVINTDNCHNCYSISSAKFVTRAILTNHSGNEVLLRKLLKIT